MDKSRMPPQWWWDKDYAVEYFRSIDTYEKFKRAREDAMGPYQDPIPVLMHLLDDVLKKKGTLEEYAEAVDQIRPFLVPWAKEIQSDWQNIVSRKRYGDLLNFFWICRQWGFPDSELLESFRSPMMESMPQYVQILNEAIQTAKT